MKKIDIFLLLILILAMLVRIWGIQFGLPHERTRPDEYTIVTKAMGFGQLDFNPHFFNYPTLLMYSVFFLYGLYYLYGLILGKYTGPVDMALEYYTDPGSFYLISRLLIAFLGTATVWIVYKICKDQYGQKSARFAALFLALAYLHVRESHFGVTDIPMTFLIMCTVYYIMKIYHHGHLKHYILAGLFAGLAASTKYNGLMLITAIFIAHIAAHLKNLKQAFKDRSVLIACFIFTAAFVLSSPYIILDYRAFIRDFSYEMRHITSGHLGIILERGWWYHLTFSLWHGLGRHLLILGLMGIIFMIMRDWKQSLVLLSFPIIYYIIAGRGLTVFVRYMLPVVPFLCISAAVLSRYLSDRLALIFPNRKRYAILTVFVLLILFPSVFNVILFNNIMTKKDTRVIAREWILNHAKSGQSICQFGTPWGLVQLPVSTKKLREQSPDSNDARIVRRRIEYQNTHHIPDYDRWFWDASQGHFLFNGQVQTDNPDFIIMERSPLKLSDAVPRYIERLVETQYQLLLYIKASDLSDARNRYDQQDAFYVPYAGFHRIKHPGPNLYIYRRKS